MTILLIELGWTWTGGRQSHSDTLGCVWLLFNYLFGVLRRFQHCTGHITTGSWKGRGNQYIQFARVLYCKLPTNGKQLPAFPLEAVTGIEPRPQRREARVLPLCHRGPVSGLQCYVIVMAPCYDLPQERTHLHRVCTSLFVDVGYHC